MKASDIVKNAPNSIVYSVTAIFVAVIAAFVILAITGSSSTDFRSFINTVMNIAGVALSGGAAVAAGAAAKSAANADTQTNGQLTEVKNELAALKAAVKVRDQNDGNS